MWASLLIVGARQEVKAPEQNKNEVWVLVALFGAAIQILWLYKISAITIVPVIDCKQEWLDRRSPKMWRVAEVRAVRVSQATARGTSVSVVPMSKGMTVGREPLHAGSLFYVQLRDSIDIVHPDRRAIVSKKQIPFDLTCVEWLALKIQSIFCGDEPVVRSVPSGRVKMLRQGFEKED